MHINFFSRRKLQSFLRLIIVSKYYTYIFSIPGSKHSNLHIEFGSGVKIFHMFPCFVVLPVQKFSSILNSWYKYCTINKKEVVGVFSSIWNGVSSRFLHKTKGKLKSSDFKRLILIILLPFVPSSKRTLPLR